MESNGQETNANLPEIKGIPLKININFKKQNLIIDIGLDNTISEFRLFVASITGVAPGLQKLMWKGLLKEDSKTVSEMGMKDGIKMMLVGSTITEVMSASSAPTPNSTSESKAEETAAVIPLSEQTQHKKIIDKGLPEGAEPGKRNKHENLPEVPLQNILNNIGQKVRLTFKMWTQELWIQSASNTQKLPFMSIRQVTSEPIKGNEDYHIVVLHLGSTDKQKYFLYWVPSQYTRAIKTSLTSDYLGGY